MFYAQSTSAVISERERQTDRQTDRDRDTERDRERHRHRQTDRQRQRQRDGRAGEVNIILLQLKCMIIQTERGKI